MNWLRNLLFKKYSDDLYHRVESELDWERNRLKDEWSKRRQQLELEYAMIKRERDHLMHLLVDLKKVEIPQIIISKDSIN